MFNRQRTLERFGYDLDLSVRRRTQAEFEATNGINKKDLMVVDNCPSCDIEREIQLRASKKNALCLKCFHNLPSTILAKQNQNKVKTSEHIQKMKDNHWSKSGYKSAFKGKQHTEETKEFIKNAANNQWINETEKEKLNRHIKISCTKRGILVEDFDGFSSPENTRIRQSPEGRLWTYDVLAKSNFTCDKCQVRGGSLVAHHLNGFNSFPNQRFLLDNGICLCEECHEKFHTQFGRGGNTAEQYKEFKTV